MRVYQFRHLGIQHSADAELTARRETVSKLISIVNVTTQLTE